jgi:hypothetical protein
MSTPRLPALASVLTLILAVSLASCSDGPTDSPTAPTAPDGPELATDAYCALYPHICTPSTSDPAPSAPGYYGATITDQYCIGELGGISDADADGLADQCETWLAIKFAPRMIYDRADDIRRESYWAAKSMRVAVVRVFYALGYYFDHGTIPEEYYECKFSTVWDTIADCDEHHGDSEFVVLELRYNRTTKHWYLYTARLSRHGDVLVAGPGPNGFPTLVTYPDKVGGYPNVFVARYKHANYPSRQTCNDGGGAPWPFIELFGYDDCSSNDQSYRPDVLSGRNLGSSARQLVDCVRSTYSFYQDPPRTECMWSAAKFYGWQLDHTTSAKGYGSWLRAEGF